ncbi:uncharacterized protein LOC121753890 isoform X1 [Salvia splendens]|uniref:uncharacterized protein LOC121753890 isoform X1 n=2 Tax=Salvia splendens TaxID=180675 RepID=UPI001C26DA60|nr:uncharacterized protein LOC121753890 isoform X1 [Salvia splendens]
MALFKFAPLCIDLVVWPAIALVYPLFVSIRAVETGSGYHMRKLVRYWIMFSLFSLFEFALVKVIEWIPFWSGVRLAVIFCLVMPQFEGACLAYQGLVSSFIDRFDMLMEERLCKRRTFLDAVDKYINENGSEALEKLIASQMTPPEARVENRCLETPLLKKSEQEWTCGLCKMTSVGLSTLNAHLQGSMHKSKLEILKASLLNAKDTGSSPLSQVQHTRSFSAAWDLKGTYAAAEFKERMPPKEPENTLLKKTEQEWTCDLCKVTTASKSMLNAHFQGSKHKSKLESPKACLLDTKDTGPPPLVEHAQSQETADSEVKEMTPRQETAEKWNCDMCKVTAMDLLTFNGHLQGCKHKAKLETIQKESLVDAKDTGSFSPLHAQPVSAAWDLNGTLEAAKDKEMMPPKETRETRLLETPLLKKAQQEWTAFITSVENVQSIPAGWDLKGTYAAAEVKQMMPPKETAEKSGPDPETPLHEKAHQEWNCDQCKVTTTDPLTLNGHLQWGEDNAKLETILKENLLDAKDTGPILPLVQHTLPVSAAWDLNGTLEAAKNKKLMLPKETAETRLPETPLLKKAQQEWTAFITNAEHAQSIPAGWDQKGTYAASEVIEMMPPTGTAEKGDTGTPLPEKAHQEWHCDLCKVTTSDPLILNGHLKGCRHKAKLKRCRHKAKLKTIQKESLLDTEDTGPLSPLVQHAQTVSANWDLNGTVEVAKDKEMMPPKETAEMRLPETSLLKKSQQELNGDMSKVTTESEFMLNDHLQGSQHKSKLETTLKASLLEAKDTGPSPSQVQHLQSVSAAWDLNGTHAAFEEEKIVPPKETAERRLPASPLLKKDKQEWAGDLCKVPTESVSTLNDHLEASNPNSKLETALEGTYAAAEMEGLMLPKETAENRLPETPLLKTDQPEGTGDVFNVTTKRDSMLNDHVQGNQPKSKLERALKASLLKAKDTGLSSLHTQPVSAAWFLKGTYVASEAREIRTPKETAEKRSPEIPLIENAQQKWTSDPCKVTTTNKIPLNGHLQETKHKDKLEFTKKESLLELEKHTASKNGHVKGSDSHRDVQVVKSEVKNGSPAALKEVQYMQPIEVPKCTYSNTEVKETKPPLKASRAGNPPFKKERIVKSEAKNGSSALQEVQYAQRLKVPGKTYANTEVKETMPPPEASRAVTPPLKQEWRCALCKVKATGEKDLNAHLLGNKHKDKLESLKKRKGKLVVLEISGTFRHWCILCDAKMATDVALASHIGGKRHASRIDEIEKLETSLSAGQCQ